MRLDLLLRQHLRGERGRVGELAPGGPEHDLVGILADPEPVDDPARLPGERRHNAQRHIAPRGLPSRPPHGVQRARRAVDPDEHRAAAVLYIHGLPS
jgi:hypothetical protein